MPIADLLNTLRTDVINSLQANNRNATGKTIANLEIVTTETSGQLLAPWWIDALEVGRKPTGPNPEPGNPPMIDNIKEWVEAKGLPDSAAWAIKKKIDKEGYVGTPGVLSIPCGDDNVNMRTNEYCNKLADEYVLEMMDILSVLK